MCVVKVGELLAVGRTADVHAWGSREVVKIPRPHTPPHWATVEAELSAAIHRHGLPTPEVRELTLVDGRECVVFERVDGVSMWERMLDEPTQIGPLTDELVAVQRMIHEAGIPAGIPDLTSRLHSKVAACQDIDRAMQVEAAGILTGLQRGAALLHGDLHPGNVLLSSDGPVVIDWFDASIGHPVADVVRSSLLLRLGFEGSDERAPSGTTRALRRRIHTRYIEAWQELMPIDTLRPQWEPLLAVARLSEGADREVAPLLELWEQRAIALH